jgi:Flp pilus assembly protein TadG
MISLFNSGKAKGRRGLEGGGSLVEFALLCPMLMAILFGMADLGRWVFLDIEVSSAAHAGAQFGSQSQANANNSAGITTAARNDAPDFSGTTLTVTPVITNCYCPATPSSTFGCGGTTICKNGNDTIPPIVLVQVTTSGTYTPWISYLPFTSNVTINGYAQIPLGQY